MAEINHRVGIKGTAQQIYAALTQDALLSKWWTTDTSGAGSVGSIIKFRFNGHGPDCEVIRLEPNKMVKWKCIGGENQPEAWQETEIVFTLTNSDKQTFIHFKHANWQESNDFMAHCCTKWAVFLLSLKDFIETGIGKPFPNDIQIDHT